jgi:hypothetical protein
MVSAAGADEDKAPAAAVSIPPKPQFHLYLLIGQSNMAGRGKMTDADRRPVYRLLKLDKADQWIPATHPLHFDKPSIAGVGLGMSFALEMRKARADVVVGLIPCAVGGTRLNRWVREGDLYKEALRRTKIAMKDGTLRGVLWHQGEGDSGSEELADTYGERLAKMIADLRSDLNTPDLPFVAGRLGEFYIAKVGTDAVRTVDKALETIGDRVDHAACASAEGLKHKGDVVHFSADALREFGRRYAVEMKKLQQ